MKCCDLHQHLVFVFYGGLYVVLMWDNPCNDIDYSTLSLICEQ